MKGVFLSLAFSALFSAVATVKLAVVSRQQLNDMTKYMSSAGLLVMFDKFKEGKENRSALEEMILRSRHDFELFIIKSVKFDCKKEPTDKACQFPGEQNLVFWTNWKKAATYLPMDLIDSQTSLFAHCLMVMAERKTKKLKSQKDVKDLLESANGEQHPTVLGYFERFGSQEHKSFMTVAMTLLDDVHIGYTNRSELDFLDSGSNKEVPARVVAVVQSDEEDAEETFSFTYKETISEVELNKYIRIFTLPLTTKLLSLEVDDPYSLYGLHIACILMLPEQFQQHKLMIERLARRFRDSFGFVLVDMKRFGKRYRMFGLDSPKTYPVLSIKIHGDLDRFEFIENPEDFSEDFLIAFLNSTRNVYQEAKTSKDVMTLTEENYRSVMYLSGKDVIVAFCHDYYESCNLNFHATWRRLGRGVRVAGYSEKLIVAFVSASETKEALEDDIADFPDIRFKYGNSEEFIGYQHKGKTPQRKLKPLLRFLVELGYPDIPVMKKRDSDEVPIIIPKSLTLESPPQIDSLSTTEKTDSSELYETAMHELDQEIKEEEERQATDSFPEDQDDLSGALAPVGKPESVLPEDEEEGEPEDDEVAGSVFYLTHKKKAEWRDRTVALTDKTIDIKRSECGVLVVHFLSPWGAKSKAFVPFYMEASKNFSSHTSLVSTACFTHVDCTAYPDVCARFNVLVYPTVIIIRGDEVHTYRGSLDARSLMQTVQLFQFGAVIELSSDNDVETFVNENYPPFVVPFEFNVLGLFKLKDSKAYEEYEAVAVEGRAALPYTACFGDVAKTWAENFNVALPAVVALRRGKYLLPETALFQQTAKTSFDRGNITQFISKTRLSITELTLLNFPQFYSAGLPLAIAFVDGENFYYEGDLNLVDGNELQPQERVFYKVLSDVAQDPKFNSKLLFCWIDVNKNSNLLRFYSKNVTAPTMVIVDHSLGDVYVLMDEGVLTPSDVLKWIQQYVDGELSPIRKLRTAEWKPVVPPFDFLAKEDAREAAKAQGKTTGRGGGFRFRDTRGKTSDTDFIPGETRVTSEHLHDEL